MTTPWPEEGNNAFPPPAPRGRLTAWLHRFAALLPRRRSPDVTWVGSAGPRWVVAFEATAACGEVWAHYVRLGRSVGEPGGPWTGRPACGKASGRTWLPSPPPSHAGAVRVCPGCLGRDRRRAEAAEMLRSEEW